MASTASEHIQSRKPLVDYSFDESFGDCSQDSNNILDHTLDTLKSHLAVMQTMVNDDECCRLRWKVQLNEQMKDQQKRVSLVLENQKSEEEERKVKVIQNVIKTTKKCSKKLTSVKLDTGIFRRFSPRRITLKGGAKSRRLKTVSGVKVGKLTPRRRTAFNFLLFSERLCFKTME